ncbi:uncharacterized protein ARMOST_15207 [Armillaria ostoyae]|uniref:Reverse transcriptase Ty1/copia-type domain-containing protein n=1 Tax=Armillaria ostoyae TaxID=47428 RepID=A0A284RSQ1_ARMOS|nr:uncharacterized protein ARMOST_15207 [Armillaria ostoyae]
MSAFTNEITELTEKETKREPRNYKEAMSSPDCDLWEDAMWSELCKIIAAETYNLVDLPAGFKTLGSTWTFRIKQDETHAITEYKARICVQGFTQVSGIDFSDMYAPTSKIEVVHLLLSMAAIHDWEFHTVDVNSTILNTKVNLLKSEIHEHVQIKDGGKGHYLLGIEIICDQKAHTISISHCHYIEDLAEHFHLNTGRDVWTLMNPFVKLSKDDCPKTEEDIEYMKTVPYQSAVGGLMHAAVMTCLDLAFPTHKVVQFMQNPGKVHWHAV